MIDITVQPGENVFDAIARGLGCDFHIADGMYRPPYRPDVFYDGPQDYEYPEPVATVSSHRWTYNIYRAKGYGPLEAS